MQVRTLSMVLAVLGAVAVLPFAANAAWVGSSPTTIYPNDPYSPIWRFCLEFPRACEKFARVRHSPVAHGDHACRYDDFARQIEKTLPESRMWRLHELTLQATQMCLLREECLRQAKRFRNQPTGSRHTVDECIMRRLI